MTTQLLKYKQHSAEHLLNFYLDLNDEMAFLELYNRYRDKLIGFFKIKSGSAEICNDLIQETYLNLLNSKTFQSNSIRDFGDYLMQTAFNTYSAYLKGKKKNTKQREEFASDRQGETSEPASDSEIYETKIAWLNEAIAALPTTNQLKAIKLRKTGYSYREIAAKMDITLKEVTNLIYRAKLNLRKKISDGN